MHIIKIMWYRPACNVQAFQSGFDANYNNRHWNAIFLAYLFMTWRNEHTWPRCSTMTRFYLPEIRQFNSSGTRSALLPSVLSYSKVFFFRLSNSMLPLLSINNNCRVIVNVCILRNSWCQQQKNCISCARQRSDSNAKRTQHLANMWTINSGMMLHKSMYKTYEYMLKE